MVSMVSMVSMLDTSAINVGFKPKTTKLAFATSPLSLQQELLRLSKECLAWNEDNVSELSDMSTHRLLTVN